MTFIIAELFRYMYADISLAIHQQRPRSFASFMYNSNVISKENYDIILKMDELSSREQAAVLLYFLREKMNSPKKYKLFLEALRNSSFQLYFQFSNIG